MYIIPNKKGACHGRRGRVCVPGDGQASRRALERLAYSQTLRCIAVGVTYGRVAAWCRTGGVDLSCEMVRQGMARRWERFWRDHQCPSH